MRVHATCNHCGHEFLLFQLYNAEPATATLPARSGKARKEDDHDVRIAA